MAIKMYEGNPPVGLKVLFSVWKGELHVGYHMAGGDMRTPATEMGKVCSAVDVDWYVPVEELLRDAEYVRGAPR